MTGKSHTIGTRAQVWHGTAKKTSGGLTKSDLMMNKHGRVVSKAKHFTAKKENRLLKHGYGTQKGKFGFVKVGSRKHRGSKKHHKKGSKRMQGGSGMGELNPAGVDGSYMIKDVVPQQFSPLDRALVGGKRRKMRGGVAMGSGLFPGDVDGQGITNYGASGSIGVQEAAGMAGGRARSRQQRRQQQRQQRQQRQQQQQQQQQGGTTSRSMMGQGTAVRMGSPLNAALNAA